MTWSSPRGRHGISKSEASRICGELDAVLKVFRERTLGHVEFPYVFLDATYVKGRVRGRVVSRAVVICHRCYRDRRP